MNNRRRAIRRAVRSSLYWSMMWRVAEANPDAAAEILAGFDRAKLRGAIDTMRGRRPPLWELANAPESILSPANPSTGIDPLEN